MKRFFFIALVLWLGPALASHAQDRIDSSSVRPKVGLVLSGGGARGAAHVGVIRLIEEMDIPVDCVVGTSMGAIIGALYAIGYTADEMDSLLMAQDWKILLSNNRPRREQSYAQRMTRKSYQVNIPYGKGVPTETPTPYRNVGIKVRRTSLQTFPKVLARPGLIDGRNLIGKFAELTSAYPDSISYDSLPRPFACVATDLVTGREMVLRSGNLAESIRASMAIPGVFHPIYKSNKVLVDGGVVNNYPVNVAREMGADIIIGVEVNSDSINANELYSFAGIFERLIGTLGTELHERNVEDTDVLIRPKVKQFPVMRFDTANLRQMIDIGYFTAQQSKSQFDSLRHLLYSYPEREPLLSVLVTTDTLQPRLVDVASLPSVISPDPNHHVSLGLRFDSEDAAAALLSIGTNAFAQSGPEMELTVRLSINPWVMARVAYAWPHLFQFNALLSYWFSDVNRFYNKSGHAFNYHFYGSDLYLSRLLSSHYDLRFGARTDYFVVRNLVRNALSDHNYMLSRNHDSYTTLYLALRNDLYDDAYFPTRGWAYNLEAACNLNNRNCESSPFWSLNAEASTVVPLGRTTALQPALYVRSLLGESIPLTYANALGGYLPGRYLRQQLPFVGLIGCEFSERHLGILRLKLRQQLYPDVYLSGIVNYAYSTSSFSSDSSIQHMWGLGLGLSYDTTLGPLSLFGHWGDLHHRFGVYFSFGFEF